MKLHPSRLTSLGLLAVAIGAATSAGAASATSEPPGSAGPDPASGAAPGCVEITALLDAADGITTAFFAEDGAAIGALFATLPALGDAAAAAAPPEIAETVSAWVAPLADLASVTAGIDFTDMAGAMEVMSSLPPSPESDDAEPEVQAWAAANCGWTSSFVDPFADPVEPPDCEVLDAAAAASAAGIDIDTADSDGTGDFNLLGYWTKSCSYGDGAMTLGTISFTSIEQATEFFADNIGDGEILETELGSLPASTLVTVRDGLIAVTVFEAAVPFSVGFVAADVAPEAAVAAAEAVWATLPDDATPSMSSDAP